MTTRTLERWLNKQVNPSEHDKSHVMHKLDVLLAGKLALRGGEPQDIAANLALHPRSLD